MQNDCHYWLETLDELICITTKIPSLYFSHSTLSTFLPPPPPLSAAPSQFPIYSSHTLLLSTFPSFSLQPPPPSSLCCPLSLVFHFHPSSLPLPLSLLCLLRICGTLTAIMHSFIVLFVCVSLSPPPCPSTSCLTKCGTLTAIMHSFIMYHLCVCVCG